MSKLSMSIGGTEVVLRWDLRAMLALEEQGYGVGRLMDEAASETPTKARLRMCAAMINSGAAHRGEKSGMTAEELEKLLTPAKLRELVSRMHVAYLVGMRREEPDANDDETIDVVLEELQKKRGSKKTRKDS